MLFLLITLVTLIFIIYSSVSYFATDFFWHYECSRTASRTNYGTTICKKWCSVCCLRDLHTYGYCIYSIYCNILHTNFQILQHDFVD